MFDRWYTAIKDIFFFVWLFFLFTISMNSITGKNEAIIVELKELGLFFVEWHFYHLFWGLPSLDFSQLQKMMPALAFNFMIAATNAWRGKWNRHAVASDNFFTHVPFLSPAPTSWAGDIVITMSCRAAVRPCFVSGRYLWNR